MFEYLYEWLWNFVCYMILMTAFIQVLPNNSYQKYIRFFFGLIMILLLASPFFRILGMETKLDEIYQSSEYRDVVKEIEQMDERLREKEKNIWKEDGE